MSSGAGERVAGWPLVGLSQTPRGTELHGGPHVCLLAPPSRKVASCPLRLGQERDYNERHRD